MTLRRVDRLLLGIERAFALLGGVAVASLVLLAVVSVGGRKLFNAPLPGYVDWIEQAMPLIAFLGLSFTQRNDGHIRMDMLTRKLKGRTLWTLEAFATFVMLSVTLLLIWGTGAHFLRSFDIAAPLWSRDSSIDIALPLWPAKLIVPLAFSLLALRLGLQLWGFVRAGIFCRDPLAVPDATPHDEDDKEADFAR